MVNDTIFQAIALGENTVRARARIQCFFADLAKVHGNFVSFLILCIIPNMIDDQGGFFTLVIDFFDNRFQHTSFD